MPAQRLEVYLGPERVGALARQNPTRYRFEFAAETAERHGDGALVLSASLPVRSKAYANAEAKPFFEGLLPEGSIRDQVAHTLQLNPANGFGLLAELGRDCAGAVVVLTEGSPPPGPGWVEWLDEPQLERALRDLPRAPLGIDPAGRVRHSLGGVQDKLIVTRDGDLTGMPRDGAPSTHIVKPGRDDYPDIVTNEAFCLEVARRAGLPAAAACPQRIGALDCLVIERFDRVRDEAGAVERVHQEDFCQALGLLPGAKYEHDGGPGVAAAVGLLRRVVLDFAADVNRLLDAVLLNFLLGNSDAHAKNFALLYDGPDRPRLAPLYDVVSTTVYPELTRDLAMGIGGETDPDRIGLEEWRRLAAAAGLGSGLVRRLPGVADRIVATCETIAGEARADGRHRPVIDLIVEVARTRARQLR